MKRFVRVFVSIGCLGAILLPSAGLAFPGNGVDLSWGRCFLGGGAFNQNFACAGPDQEYRLICQFKLNRDTPHFVAITWYITIRSDEPAPPLSPFWHYETGGCQRRGGSNPDGVAMSKDVRDAPGCSDYDDPWGGDGQGIGGFVYGADIPSPGRARLILSNAYPAGPGVPLTAGTNYYSHHLIFNNLNRASCAGCGQFKTVSCTATLEFTDEPPLDLYGPDKGQDHVGINAAPTAAANRTWGQIKSLYR